MDPGETFWQAMKREFREETGVKLPRLTRVRSVDTYHGKVRIYVADLPGPVDRVLPPPRALRTAETRGWTTAPLRTLMQRKNLRRGVVHGLQAAHNAGLL